MNNIKIFFTLIIILIVLNGCSTTQKSIVVACTTNEEVEKYIQSNIRLKRETGKLSREEIQLVFDCNKGSISSIYHKHLVKDPGLSGRLIVIFDVDANGQVSNILVESNTIDNQEFIRELRASIKLYKFPVKIDRTMNNRYPIEFIDYKKTIPADL